MLRPAQVLYRMHVIYCAQMTFAAIHAVVVFFFNSCYRSGIVRFSAAVSAMACEQNVEFIDGFESVELWIHPVLWHCETVQFGFEEL